MRFVFFSHYFPPEGNAPASRTYEHCVRWAVEGHEITVITGVPNVPDGVVYPGYKNRFWPQREIVDGIEVIRVWTYVAANAGGLKRILNYVSYMVFSVVAFLFLVRRPRFVIATTPQFFCGWAGVIASWLKWSPLILEVRDIWPESIVTVGAMKKGVLVRVIEVLERAMYCSARHIITVGEGYRTKILERVDIPDRISIVTNGVSPEQFAPALPSSDWLESHGLQGRFVCSYVGTIGMAHGLMVVVEAAEKLRRRGRSDIVFCLVGDGANAEELREQIRRRGLDEWVRFTGRIPKSDVPMVLASSSVLLIHLRKTTLFESVIPSKIFEGMAMNRPVILGVRGEAAKILDRAKAGIQIEPENATELCETLVLMKDQPALYRSMCEHGRPFVVEHYSRDMLAARMLAIIRAKVGCQAAMLDSRTESAKPN